MTQTDELAVAALNVLHNLFYHAPSADYLGEIGRSGLLNAWPPLGDSAALQAALTQISTSLMQDSAELIERDYYALFIGPGPALAYPWGSVYTDRENLVCGATTIAYDRFCREHGITLKLDHHQPSDHFGLMLAVLAALLAKGNQQGVDELLGEHLMPWAPRLLERVNQHAKCGIYRGGAVLAGQLLSQLTENRGVLPQSKPLHF